MGNINEIYLNRSRSKEHEVPYFNREPETIHLRADLVYKLSESGSWDIRHREFLQPLALGHKILKCIPGTGPGCWKVVEILNG